MSTSPNQLSQEDRHGIYQFIKQHPVGVLATVSPSGDPQASTIYISADDQLSLTFTTKHDTKKFANIQHHNTVMLAVYDASTQTTVQAIGHAVIVKDAQEAQDIFRNTIHSAQTTGEDVVPPIAKISAGEYVAYKIIPDTIWMTAYGWGNTFNNALNHANDQPSNTDPA